MKIDFKNNNAHLIVPFCEYYDKIVIHARRVKNTRLSTPDHDFVSFRNMARHYDMPIVELKYIFNHLDEPSLSNSPYFPQLKVGVVPKYIGFKDATYYTGT